MKEFKPFCFTSLAFIFVGLLFPLMTVALLVLSIHNGFDGQKILALLIGLVLSFVVGRLSILKIFDSKIVFHDNEFTVFYYETANSTNRKFEFFPKRKSLTIKYSNLYQYGVFKSGDLKKGGRDERQRKIAVFVNDGVPVPVIIPHFAEALKDIMMFNDTNGNSVIVETKPYSEKQVLEILKILKEKAKIEPLNNFANVKRNSWIWGLIGIATLILGAIIGLKLPVLEALIVTSHGEEYNSPFKILYGIAPMFAGLGAVGAIICKRNIGAKAQETTLMQVESAIKFFNCFLFGGIAVTVIGFILSIFIDWPQ